MKPDLRAAILELIENGTKATELAAHFGIMLTLIPNLDTNEFLAVVEELIKQGEIVEVEYILPHMPYRIKSFLLPKGTKVIIK